MRDKQDQERFTRRMVSSSQLYTYYTSEGEMGFQYRWLSNETYPYRRNRPLGWPPWAGVAVTGPAPSEQFWEAPTTPHCGNRWRLKWLEACPGSGPAPCTCNNETHLFGTVLWLFIHGYVQPKLTSIHCSITLPLRPTYSPHTVYLILTVFV
jgi:hypothetical protein